MSPEQLFVRSTRVELLGTLSAVCSARSSATSITDQWLLAMHLEIFFSKRVEVAAFQ